MMSVMHEIEDYVLDRPIAVTSAYDKLVEKFRAAFLARQHFQPQLVEVYQPQIGESPKSPWRQSLARESYPLEFR